MLHDRQGDAENIGFLKGVGPDGRAGDLPGDHHHRHGIHLGRGDARHQVGGPWTRGSETDTHLAGGPCVGISGMGSRLLVAHQDVLHPAFALSDVQGVIYRQDRPARVTEDRVHPMSPQRIHQGFRAADGLRRIGIQSTDNR